MKKININTLLGKLIMPEHKYEYGVFDSRTADIKFISITDILNEIYKTSPTCEVKIQIEVKKKKGSTYNKVFESEGELYMDKSDGVWDWFVAGKDLGKVLFENTNEDVYIEICDLDYYGP